MKKPSEGEFGAALREVELVAYVYRPADPRGGEGVGNWKPCDFMAWRRTESTRTSQLAASAWFEVKDMKTIKGFPLAELRPAQLAGIRDARRVGIPYWLAVWWRQQREWTISDAARVVEWFAAERAIAIGESVGELAELREKKAPTSIPRNLLESRFGVSCSRAQLSSTLKQVLLGEAS